MGAGKTSVLAEASDILALRNIHHAAIDLDALGLAHLPSAASNDGATYRNLQSVCTNYAALGVTRVLLAGAMEDRAELELCRKSVSAANITVCRLAASISTMQERVTRRESGILQREYVTRVAKLENILDHAQLEDFTIFNENRSLHDVALEMLIQAQWIAH